MEDRGRDTWLWITGRLSELHILGLVGTNKKLVPRFWTDFRNTVLSGFRPSREESMPFLEQEFGDEADNLWLMICASVDKQDELFEAARRAIEKNERAE